MLTRVRSAVYPVVVTIDADLENDPALIPILLARLEEGYDLVAESGSKLPRWSERLFSATVGRRIGVTDVLSNFRAIRTEQAKAKSIGGRPLALNSSSRPITKDSG